MWSSTLVKCHINLLELMTAFLCLKRLDPPQGCHVHLIMDNMTAALCVRREGSSSPHLNTVLNPIVALAKRKDWFLFANAFEWYAQWDGKSSPKKRSSLNGGDSGQAVLRSDSETESTSGDKPLCNTLEQQASTVLLSQCQTH